MPSSSPILLLCTGLGRINRGFEQYIASLATHLSAQPGLPPPEVWCGGPWTRPGVRSRRIANLPRSHRWLKGRSQAFLWEQRTFFVGMLWHLLWRRPRVIYLGEYQLYCYLYKLRSWLGLRYSLVLYTGGQAIPGLFRPQLDFVHHITDAYLAQCTHLPAERQTVLPHFIEDDFAYDEHLIASIRQRAGHKKIVLSVGLLDKSTKAMHLLVAALAASQQPVYPVLLGASSADTAELRQLLEQHFGHHGYFMNSMLHPMLGNWYAAADLFVLCSPKESFGLALVEALWHGLPVVCRPMPETKWVLQDQAIYCAMETPWQLCTSIAQALQQNSPALQAQRRAFAQQQYSWTSLAPRYQQLFQQLTHTSNTSNISSTPTPQSSFINHHS